METSSLFGRRILILVPHPDDEVVGCAAAIGRAQAEGAELFALYLTHGCIARETLWPWQRGRYAERVALRQAEAEKTLSLLGLKSAGESLRPARYVWREMNAVYAGIKAAVAAYDIDQLWVPAYEGGNADHDAANAIALRWQSEGGKDPAANIPAVLEFAEYNFSGGKKHSQEFPTLAGNERVINLTSAEREKKRAALSLYASEKQNLNYVEIARESYRPLRIYDYSRPAHAGALWYARFQWVPFRHPRVDFTAPAEVCDAIGNFLKRPKP